MCGFGGCWCDRGGSSRIERQSVGFSKVGQFQIGLHSRILRCRTPCSHWQPRRGLSSGGLRLFKLDTETTLTEINHEAPDRTKLVSTAYGVGGKDLVVTIAQPDSYFRLYDANAPEQAGEPIARTLGGCRRYLRYFVRSVGFYINYWSGRYRGQGCLMSIKNRDNNIYPARLLTRLK
ncbi:hypothetical protein F5Y05DRAFT_42970 [Hypoxylon sp. FL0543]|nr:hypothetical protein F5Y05DRAFT_42970 [Hypoxylon sp. FL0543]